MDMDRLDRLGTTEKSVRNLKSWSEQATRIQQRENKIEIQKGGSETWRMG